MSEQQAADHITLALTAGAEQARAIADLSRTVAEQAQTIADLHAELAELRAKLAEDDDMPAPASDGTLD